MQSMWYFALIALACMTGVTFSDEQPVMASTTIATIITGYYTSQSTTASPTLARSLSSTLSNSTCPRETVNHIFYTLPQQCLRTSRQLLAQPDPSSSANSIPDGISLSTSETQTNQPQQTNLADLNDSVKSLEQTRSTQASIQTETSSSTVSSEQPAASKEEDGDSPLDNANFLSFEEWKKQNLARAGQAIDDVGRSQNVNGNRPRPGIQNALDTLGEESEINIDFAAFGRDPSVLSNESASKASTTSPSSDAEQSNVVPPTLRSKDAGKTCKERTNYASFDCAATVLKANKECKSASSVLVENKDSYMLNICSATNKHFIVELCNDILVDTIVLANYEFFSSSLRHFRVSVSDRYPAKADKWRDLGTFEARNTREVQAFLIQNPLIWARFLRVEFLTHYGNEYYCPLSLLRVHGTTMLEEFRHQEELARDEEDDATLEVEMHATPAISSSLVGVTAPLPLEVDETAAKPQFTLNQQTHPEDPSISSTFGNIAEKQELTLPASEPLPPTSAGSVQPSSGPTIMESIFTNSAITSTTPLDTTLTSSSLSSSSINLPPSPSTGSTAVVSEAAVERTGSSIQSPQIAVETSNLSASSTISSSHQNYTSARPPPESSVVVSSSNGSNTAASSDKASEAGSSLTDTPVPQAPTAVNKTRSNIASSSSSQQSQPPTQESFFKSVHKRLQQLESNSTLSLKYIEEQSRILRDAFSVVEKRQVSKTANFLSNLNGSVMSELNGFRQAYDQLFQSTVFELEGQREQNQREMLALNNRLSLVADELVWQKRMGILQSALLLLCLAMALFSRAGTSESELPLMRQVMNRSTTALRATWESPPNSPSPGSRSPVSLFRRKLFRTNSAPGNVNQTDSDVSRPSSAAGLDVNIEPPTPGSASPRTLRSDSEVELDRDSSTEGTDEEKIEPARASGSGHMRSKSLGLNGTNTPRTRSPLAMGA